jgi:hypothetical protein
MILKQKQMGNVLLIALFLFFYAPANAVAIDYSSGDACSNAVSWHQQNDANGVYNLICDGSRWIDILSFSSAGLTTLESGVLEVGSTSSPNTIVLTNSQASAIQGLETHSFSRDTVVLGFNSAGNYVDGFYDSGGSQFKGMVQTGTYSTFWGDTWDINDPVGGSSAGIRTTDGQLHIYAYGTLQMSFDQQNSATIEVKEPLALENSLIFKNQLTPSMISSNQNDYNPTDLADANVLRLASDAQRNITGLSYGWSGGRVIVVLNVGNNPITLVNESASSTANQRFSLGEDVTLNASESISLVYDMTSLRWRAMNRSGAIWTQSGSNIYYSSGYVGINYANPSVALDVVGDIEYTGVLTDVSDRRMKENIAPLRNSLDGIKSLNGYSFTMKSDPDGKVEYGLIAQEVEPEFPELVITKHDGLKSLNYTGLIAPIIESIKEQQKQIDELRAENDALRKELSELQSEE